VVGFIEIFFFDFYFHHHFDGGCDVLSVIIAFEGLFEAKKGFYYFLLVVVNETFVVVSC
jgi:hypothetical protein